jgi:hypothetical protein
VAGRREVSTSKPAASLEPGIGAAQYKVVRDDESGDPEVVGWDGSAAAPLFLESD